MKKLILLCPFALVGCAEASDQSADSVAADDDTFSVMQGRAESIEPVLLECDVEGWRVTAQGSITDTQGRDWVTPAQVNFREGPKATDLFNECNEIELPDYQSLDLSSVPVIELDPDGEVYTTYFFGDNYAEIFVNGQLIGVDPVPYWPFNTAVVRYRVSKPFVLGAQLVDWEENLSLGSETMRGVPFHNGDGGFVAVTKNADGELVDLTDESWRVQFYYASPLLDPACVVEASTAAGTIRNTDSCASPEKPNAEEGYAVRWDLPGNWATPEFDDSQWPQASTFTNEDIGGSLNRPAYANFASLFDDPEADAQFIWSANLLLENHVLARKTIE